MPKRNLSDEDIAALVTELKNQFFSNVGKGVWGLAWKGIVIFLVGIAVYGSVKH